MKNFIEERIMSNYYMFPCPECGNYNSYRLAQIFEGAKLYCSVDTEEEHEYVVPKEIEDLLIKYLKEEEGK